MALGSDRANALVSVTIAAAPEAAKPAPPPCAVTVTIEYLVMRY